MNIQFYIKDKIQPWQTDVNDYNHMFGMPKFDFLSYLNFVFSVEYKHVDQLVLEEFTAKKVIIKGSYITLVNTTVLDHNSIEINNNTKSVSYSVNPGIIPESLECGTYIFYLWNEAGEEYYSQPIYINGAASGDFSLTDFNQDFYV